MYDFCFDQEETLENGTDGHFDIKSLNSHEDTISLYNISTT